MGVYVDCKNKEDPIKREGTGVVTTFLPLKVYENFQYAQGQLTHKSWSDPAEFQTQPSFYGCPCYMKE